MTKELLQQALDEAKADAIYVFTYAEGISAASKDAIEYMQLGISQHASTYWPEGVKIPDLQQFESKHDAVTKELLRSISSEPPTQPALSDDRQKKV